MDWLNWIKNNAGKVLAVPAAIGGIEFLADLFVAAQDGLLTPEELQSLIAVASPFQVALIALVMYALKQK